MPLLYRNTEYTEMGYKYSLKHIRITLTSLLLQYSFIKRKIDEMD